MPSHKSKYYKIAAIKFHLENESSFVNTFSIIYVVNWMNHLQNYAT